jgi:DNA-repair protein complementing XP-A cells
LLKDCDFDFRDPPLKYMVKKNPHKSRNDMKLFLYYQVKQRAVEVHETLEEIEDKKEQRVVNLHKTRQRNYEKKLEGFLFFI